MIVHVVSLSKFTYCNNYPKIKMPKKYIPLILLSILLISEQFLPTFRYNFFIQLFSFGIILLSVKSLIINDFLIQIIKPLVILFLIGLIGMFFNNNGWVPIIKDFTYFIQPIIALLIGYFIFKSKNSPETLFRFFVYFGATIAFFHFFGVLFFGNLAQSSIHKIRGIFGLDNFVEIFSFYVLILSKRFLGKPIIENKRIYYALAFLFLGSIFLYFSRTMFFVLILVGLSLMGYTRITKTSVKYSFVFLIVIGLFYGVLANIKLDRNSKGIEAFFYKLQIAPQEIFNAKIDREDHRQLWDRFRAYEAKRALHLMEGNSLNYIVGMGHGSLVNLKFKAPLGEDMKYISRTHNGYIFVFYKTGFVGLIVYLMLLFHLFLFNMKKAINNSDKFVNYLISSIGLFYLFSSLIITGIYIPRDIMIFLLGALLAVKTQNSYSISE